MRFDIRYRTRFSYDSAVGESHNELRACPVTDAHQRFVTYRVGIAPTTRPLSFTDYWGTRVDAFGVRLPHRVLEVVAEATVETSPRAEVVPAADLADLGGSDFVARHHEYLQPTRHTEWDAGMRDRAEECADASGPTALGVARGIHDLVRSAVRYEKGATDVSTTAAEVLRGGAGVC